MTCEPPATGWLWQRHNVHAHPLENSSSLLEADEGISEPAPRRLGPEPAWCGVARADLLVWVRGCSGHGVAPAGAGPGPSPPPRAAPGPGCRRWLPRQHPPQARAARSAPSPGEERALSPAPEPGPFRWPRPAGAGRLRLTGGGGPGPA